MPAYNSQAYIADAIRSVQAQTLGDWELLVIDDGSRDDTCSIVTEMALEDPRIRLYRNEENMGAARSRNRGIAMSRGAYVALLDSDDLRC
jgi:glycosyltransferase involved in cell wall biosynthesis